MPRPPFPVSTLENEPKRQAITLEIRPRGEFDAVIDFDRDYTFRLIGLVEKRLSCNGLPTK